MRIRNPVLTFFCGLISTGLCMELKMTQVLFRHGSRSSFAVLPTDTANPASSWPTGLGELTSVGIQQVYELGTRLRDMYGALLDNEYKADKVLILTGSQNRTIMSAQAMAAGLFPPDEKLTPDLNWQPVPTHENILMELTEATDAAYKYCRSLEHYAHSEEMQKIDADNAEFLEFLSEKTGISVSKVLDLNPISDVFVCEKNNPKEHSWPDYMDEATFQKLETLYHGTEFVLQNHTEVLQLSAGWFLRQILEDMEAFIGGFDRRKFVAFSGHDNNITPMLLALRLEGQALEWPDYSAAVAFELWQNNSDYFVKVLYRKGPDQMFEDLRLMGCPSPCPYSTFLDRSRPFLAPTDWYSACNLKVGATQRDASGESSSTITILGIAVAVLFLTTIISTASCLRIVIAYEKVKKIKNPAEDVPIISRQ